MERGNSSKNVKGKNQVTENMRSNTKVLDGGGESRSSVEGTVMVLERRGFITWPELQNNYVFRRIL